MKNLLLIGAAVAGLAVTSVNAQISDNESSAALIAAYCASSSGLPASNFETYAQELALTLSQLPVVAQSRVFEDKMPMIAEVKRPNNASAQAQNNAAENSAVAQAANNTTKEAGSSDSDSGGSSKKKHNWGGLVDIVEAINNFLFNEGEESPKSVIGGNAPAQLFN